jgi:hypothetical protein
MICKHKVILGLINLIFPCCGFDLLSDISPNVSSELNLLVEVQLQHVVSPLATRVLLQWAEVSYSESLECSCKVLVMNGWWLVN